MPPDPRWTPETENLVAEVYAKTLDPAGAATSGDHRDAAAILTALADAHLLATPARRPYVPPRTGWYRNTVDGLVWATGEPGDAIHVEAVGDTVRVVSDGTEITIYPAATWVTLPWTRIHTGEAS